MGPTGDWYLDIHNVIGRNSVGDQPLTFAKTVSQRNITFENLEIRPPFCILLCPSPTPIKYIQRAYILSYIGSSTELFLSTKFDAL